MINQIYIEYEKEKWNGNTYIYKLHIPSYLHGYTFGNPYGFSIECMVTNGWKGSNRKLIVSTCDAFGDLHFSDVEQSKEYSYGFVDELVKCIIEHVKQFKFHEIEDISTFELNNFLVISWEE